MPLLVDVLTQKYLGKEVYILKVYHPKIMVHVAFGHYSLAYFSGPASRIKFKWMNIFCLINDACHNKVPNVYFDDWTVY